MRQAARDAIAFIKDSDQYQLCLKASLDDNEKQLKDLDLEHDTDGLQRRQLLEAQKHITAKADESQMTKEQVGKAYHVAAATYKASHR